MPAAYTHISFEADYSTERAGEVPPGEPPGEELLDYLEERLEDRGVRILERAATDYSHVFDIATDKHVFMGMVGLVEGHQWLLFVESTLGWWKKVLGASDETEHAAIMRAIMECLREDPRIGRLRLYRDADQWNRGDEGVEA
jgi:hypothetical protein